MPNTTGYDVVTLVAGGATDVAFSPDQLTLYVARDNGDIDVFDVITHAKIVTWHVGTKLGAISVSEDGSFLVVTEALPAQGESTLYRVSTQTGQATEHSIAGYPFYDVEVVDAHTAILTRGHATLKTFNLDTNSFADLSGGVYYSNSSTMVEDGRYTLFAESGISNGPLFLYDDQVHAFVAYGDNYQDGAESGFNFGNLAISEEGGLVLQFAYYSGINVFDLNLDFVTLVNLGERADGLAFDSSGRYAYAYLIDSDVVAKYDVATWARVDQYSVGPSNFVNEAGFGDQLLVDRSGRYLTVLLNDNGSGPLQLIDLTVRDETFAGTAGADSFRGGKGDDVYFVDHIGDVVTELPAEGSDEIQTALSSYSLAGVANVEKLTGKGIGQTLSGNELGNVIAGAGGADVIDGGAGADTMIGGGANDLYFADHSGDLIIELDGAGEDEVRTTASSFSLAGSANVEILTGSSNDQALTGNGSNNLIDGGAGADTMAGGGGHDIYIVDNLGDTVIEIDGAGTDEIRTSLGSKAAPDYALFVLPDFVENLTGTSAGAQGVRGNALDNVITMGAGNDLVVLDDGGIDSLDAGGGNDFIFYGAALTGTDTTNGGAGTDTLGLLGNYAGGNAITFTAANLIGVERLALYTGGGPNSYSVTMNDANVPAGGDFFVTAASLTSTETLFFNGFAEASGRFTVLGGSGADTIVGGKGSDYLAGNAGADILYALAGNDFIIGGLGADELTGGGGFDAFRYFSTAESTTGSVDQILDFTDLDRIDLSGIDANSNAGDGDTEFTFIGTGVFTNVAGQLRATDNGSGVWTVEGDVNGDGIADLVITVNTVEPEPLTGADFIL